MSDPDTSTELPRLYWESDESVGDIADRLDLSRRALYDGIEPRPAGHPCPECGEELVFRNRTARDNTEGECPGCGRVVELTERANGEEPAAEQEPAVEEEPADEREPAVEQERRASALSPVDRGRSGPLLAFALLVGLALGAVVGYLYRSR